MSEFQNNTVLNNKSQIVKVNQGVVCYDNKLIIHANPVNLGGFVC